MKKITLFSLALAFCVLSFTPPSFAQTLITNSSSENSSKSAFIKTTLAAVDPFYIPPSTSQESYSIVIEAASIDGIPIEAGDEIAVFDKDSVGNLIIAGAVEFDGSEIGFPAWADDNQTVKKDGYTAGNTMIFRIYDKSAQLEYKAVAVYNTGNGTFRDGIFARITSLTSSGISNQVITVDTNDSTTVPVPTDSSKITLNFSGESTLALGFTDGELNGAVLTVEKVVDADITQNFPTVPVFENAIVYFDIKLTASNFQAELTFGYTDNQLSSLNIEEGSLAVSFYGSLDSRGFIWHSVPATIDELRNLITVSTSHFSLWALTSKEEPIITDVDEEPDYRIPMGYDLRQNFPNPFNPETTISFVLPVTGEVNLNIYSTTGQLIKTLVAGHLPSGSHSFTWNGTNIFGNKVSSGTYIYQLKAGNFSLVKKMVMIK